MSSFFRLKVEVSSLALYVAVPVDLTDCSSFIGNFIKTGICVDSVLGSILKSIMQMKKYF